jgi:TRAP-type C4-dicarboxylate transport system substrate-binding protein
MSRSPFPAARPAFWRRLLATLGGLLLCLPATAADDPPIRIKVIGGLGQVSQFERYEAPFWTRDVPFLTDGRLAAEIAPSDRSGLRGQDMLRLMRLGVVPFGTVTLALASADEPELNAVDLPALSPDLAALRRTVGLWRPRIVELLRERYGLELLALYVYPAQVMFCRGPFGGLGDLGGRTVRTSAVSQSELVSALGGIPVVLPFADIVKSMRGGIVTCAITGTLSGNAIGLHEVATHLSPTAISWGVSLFAANGAAWAALPEPVRGALRTGIGSLEGTIWDAAARETELGIACNIGRPDCENGRPGKMVLVQERVQDATRRRRLLEETVLPAWVQRCGADCADQWNHLAAPSLGLLARSD